MNMIGSIGGFGGRQGQGDPVQQLLSEASQYQNNATIKADLQALQEAQQAGAAQGAPPPPPGMGMGMGMGRQGDNLSLSPEAMMIGAHQGPPPPPMGMGQGQMQGPPPPPPIGMGQGQMQGMGQMQGPPPPPPPNGQGQGQDKIATLIQQLAEDLQQVKSHQGGGF